MMKLLAAGGTNGQESCGAMFLSSRPKYLGWYHSQATDSCVARRFQTSRNIMPLVSRNLLDGGIHYLSIVSSSKLWNILSPTHLPMSRLMIIVLLLLVVLYCCWISWWSVGVYQNPIHWGYLSPCQTQYKFIACMLWYIPLRSITGWRGVARGM